MPYIAKDSTKADKLKIKKNVQHFNKFSRRERYYFKVSIWFPQKHSTQHTIITVVDKVTKAVDSGDIVKNMFIDPRKAFDTFHMVSF